ncbi:type II toxin-antitoxin system antitoxin DNA ADP-ribosyl glycohydrolase DarG [Arcticibacter eurypsychrophilus]|uniref:type II toxin-antitoxin system antitoxin DNA ADP-ribosyl glycohydrolase DarG n=1 Tax=Arcticibacter eurypsychrophilus TaxID=1434752 RepID=UPI00084D2F36|nr:macro domain-containing protein [Arcticibacter eurypsychrophilus]
MIKYTQGNLLDASVDALVNTVNTVGVMGKGIALQFKNRFANNYKVYKEACRVKSFHVGELLVVQEDDLTDKKLIINFPTKAHWRGDSRYEYIESGLQELRKLIIEKQVQSIALPPLGCGNGGLDWKKVQPMIDKYLGNLSAEVIVYTPNDHIKEILQKEGVKKEIKLTPARAMLLHLMHQYEIYGEQSSLFVVNKLAYFLQRSGENLKLDFKAHHYGPYTVQLNHVLGYLNGVYLKGMEQNQAKPFEPLFLNYAKADEINRYVETQLSFEQKQRLQNVLKLINGFESTFSLELLASVDFVQQVNKTKDLGLLVHEIKAWNPRKAHMFEERHVRIAAEHLEQHKQNVFV